MKRKARSKTLTNGKLTFSPDTIQAIVQEEDVSDEQIEQAIIFTHLILGINPYVNPTATLGFMIEGLTRGISEMEAVELGEMIARTATVSGPQKGEDQTQ